MGGVLGLALRKMWHPLLSLASGRASAWRAWACRGSVCFSPEHSRPDVLCAAPQKLHTFLPEHRQWRALYGERSSLPGLAAM